MKAFGFSIGVPGRNRTLGLFLRREALYPTELLRQGAGIVPQNASLKGVYFSYRRCAILTKRLTRCKRYISISANASTKSRKERCNLVMKLVWMTGS